MTTPTRSRSLKVVYVAGGVSAFGTQVTMLALPWLVLESSGSATRTGLVFAVQVLPLALLGFAGGEVLQRVGVRNTMFLADVARAPLVALVPVLSAVDALSFPVLLLIVALLGVLGIPYFAAQRVLAAELAGRDPRAITRANGVLEGIFNIAWLAGPAAGGVLIAWLGAAQVLWLDAASFTVSALLLLLVPRNSGATGDVAAGRGPTGMWAGLRMLREDPFLRRSVASTVLYGFLLRVLAIALPLLAFDRFAGDARLAGLLVGASGAGALLGSFATYLVSGGVEPRRMVAASMVLLALPLWVLVTSAPPLVLAVAVALSSAAVPLSNAPYFSILTTRIPDGYRAKVLQSVITLSTVAGPLGFLAAGVLTDRVGITVTLFVVALLATLATVNVLFALRYLRDDTVDSAGTTLPQSAGDGGLAHTAAGQP